MNAELPGTLWVNRGRWNWRVRLPGEAKRRNFPLRLPGAREAIPEDRGRNLAVSLAWKIWERANRAASDDAPVAFTLVEVAGRFAAWAETYYRHADGTQTRVRRKFGIEAAGAVLGHARPGARITDRYTREAIEAELIAAATPAMLALG